MRMDSEGDLPSRHMDWGLPNWRDTSDYGNVAEWGDFRWRWEFTRRRDDVRNAFLEFAVETHRVMMTEPDYAEMRPEEGKTPNDPGFWAMSPTPGLFGMTGIPNPAISNQPMLESLFIERAGGVYIGEGKDFPNYEEWTPIFLPEGSVAIQFDITLPLPPQIERAKETLGKLAKPKQRRRHRNKWLTYLRALDGREAGASWSEIAGELLGRAQREQPHAPQSAKEIWEQARALMLSWPD